MRRFENGLPDEVSIGMDEEGTNDPVPLAGNWRSALVVNSLHDALEEAERQRDEMAQKIIRFGWTYRRFPAAAVSMFHSTGIELL